jgi:hypothetical protein
MPETTVSGSCATNNRLAGAKLANIERNHFAVNFQRHQKQKQKLTKYIEIEQN